MKFGNTSCLIVLCTFCPSILIRFLMKHYSHNIKLSSYAIAVVFNLANDTYNTSHLESIVGNIDVMNLIYSRGLSEEGGVIFYSFSFRWYFYCISMDCSSTRVDINPSFLHLTYALYIPQYYRISLIWSCISSSTSSSFLSPIHH